MQARHPWSSVTAKPYFFARKKNGGIEVQGHVSAEFGHRLPSASHSMDDGVFAYWHWNGIKLTVHNDRYGYYPIFWYRPGGNGICVSPSLQHLVVLGAPTNLDLDALAVYLRFGSFVGDDTPFTAIKALPPNAVFDWSADNFTCIGQYPEPPKPSTITRDDAIDGYIDLFAKAMAKRPPMTDRCAVPISGGRDSRHIALELHRTGVQPATCVSAMDNPPDSNQDPVIGEQLCKAIGFKHATIDQQLTPFQAEQRKNRETHFCAGMHAWYLAVADHLNSRYDCVYDGIAGDMLSQNPFPGDVIDKAFRCRDVGKIADTILTELGRKTTSLSALLKRDLRQTLDPSRARERIAREVARHVNIPDPFGSFLFWNRTRRAVALAPYSLLCNVPLVYAPYLDHELFDFLTTLPASMLMDRTFHTDTIKRAYPSVAHVAYSDHKHAPRTDDTLIRRQYLADNTRHFLWRKPSSLMRNIIPRSRMLAGYLSRGLVDPYVPPIIIYLDQLECLLDQGGAATEMFSFSNETTESE